MACSAIRRWVSKVDTFDITCAGLMTEIPACLQVRTPAAELISGLTGSVEGSQKLQQHRGVLLPALQRLVAERDGSGKAALTALVNLSQVSYRAGLGLHASRWT